MVNWPELEASYSTSPDDGLMCVALYVTLDDLWYTHYLPTAFISRRLPEHRDKLYRQFYYFYPTCGQFVNFLLSVKSFLPILMLHISINTSILTGY